MYVYGYSVPTGLGWHRVSDGGVTVDVSALDAGEHRLAALSTDGELAGWAPLAAAPTFANVALWLLIPVAVLLVGGLAVLGIRRRSRVG